MASFSSSSSSSKFVFLFVVVAVVAVGLGDQPGGGGGVAAVAAAGDDDGDDVFARFDEMAKTFGGLFAHSGSSGLPSIFDDTNGSPAAAASFWHNAGPKVKVNKERKCVFSLTWEEGGKCLDFAAFADVAARRVAWRYHRAEEHRTETSTSAHSESFEQSVTLDDDCFLNEAVMEMRLAGYMANDDAGRAKDGCKVDILFPSKAKALALEGNGDLPEGTAKALEEGDVEVLSKLTDKQACALLLDGRNCHNLDRSLLSADGKVEEAPSENSGNLRASHNAAEDVSATQKTSLIPLPQIGRIETEN